MTPEKISEVFHKVENIINKEWPEILGYAPYKFNEYGEEYEWLIRFDNVNYLTYSEDENVFILDLGATFGESDDFWGIENYEEKELPKLYRKFKKLVKFIAERYNSNVDELKKEQNNESI